MSIKIDLNFEATELRRCITDINTGDAQLQDRPELLKQLELAAELNLYANDPVFFANNVLGVDVWSGQDLTTKYKLTDEILVEKYQHTSDGTVKGVPLPVIGQREVLNAIAKNPKVNVASAHNLGKTFLDAVVVAWWMVTRVPALVLCLTPTHRQVNTQLWGELRKLFRRSKEELGGFMPPKASQWDIDLDERWQAVGFSTDKTDNLQGFHHDHLLVICDEAYGIQRDLMETIDEFEPERWLNTGNPTDPVSYAGSIFHDEAMGDGWINLVMSQELSPNVLAGRRVWPNICPPDRPKKALRKYKGDRDAPQYRIRQRGQFPLTTQDNLIGWHEVQESHNRSLTREAKGKAHFGLDLGFSEGGDNSCLTARFPEVGLSELKLTQRGKNHRKLLKEVCEIMMETGYYGCSYDAIGIGASLTTLIDEWIEDPATPIELVECLESFYGVKWGRPPSADGTFVDEPDYYLNRKAELYHFGVDWVRSGGAIADLDTCRQLSKTKIIIVKGMTGIEDKKTYKTREGHSPDECDSFILTFETPDSGFTPSVF